MKPTIMAGKRPQQGRRASTSNGSSMAPYGSMPVATTSADLLSMSRMQTTSAGYADPFYPTAASPPSGHFAPISAPPYDTMRYAPAPAPVQAATLSMAPEADSSRSQSSLQDERGCFADALDASYGMLAMSHETLRNICDNRHNRSSMDSISFPCISTISSTGNFSSYYQGDSVSDYSTAGSDIKSDNSRTLPRPQGFLASQIPPAPQSMMGQFRPKVSSSTQKKHKCKVCDKRFSRPSSLRTHLYSHTGDKPFACEAEGCGRHFSVVSNLRRHRKVHRGDARSKARSEDHHSD